MGISKKRLLSIINATQCPSDTESSDESDCKNVEEHISLEEISSDSDEAGASKRKKLKKKARSAKTTTETKNGAEPPKKKEYSVLELLELQARARAIRSQLALEPVTKIELDSDNSGSSSESDVEKTKKSDEVPTGSKETAPKESQPKRVRLVRNFRKRNSDEEEEPNDESKKESSSKRDSSPEVVALIPEREILCISSDSEDDEKTTHGTKVNQEEIKVEKEVLETNKEVAMVEVEDIPKEPGTPEDGEILEEEIESEEKMDEEVKEIVEEISPPVEEPIVESKEKTPETSLEEQSIELNNMDDTLLVHVDMDELNDEMTDNFEEADEPIAAKTKSPEIFEIGDSSEEESEKEKLLQKELTATCFHERWLESKKVSKILATSRLANRVREKLKLKNKKSESDNSEVSSPTPTEIVPEVVPSNCEEGSVGHFEEIKTNE